jgi:hypothetical protein
VPCPIDLTFKIFSVKIFRDSVTPTQAALLKLGVADSEPASLLAWLDLEIGLDDSELCGFDDHDELLGGYLTLF